MNDASIPIRRPEGFSPRLLHGGDYNPDQWLDRPDVLEADIRLMQQANVNVVSLGIFAWTALEPEEGRYTFEWLDTAIDRLYAAGVLVFLATPSGARPAWLSQCYPEVLRVGPNRVRNLHGRRHNHCYTSPAYRERVAAIDGALAKRYAGHPAVALWHISNEYGGECHCPLCQDAFRGWLRKRYRDDLDALNKAWWANFWSHTYTDWSQIESPAPHGEPLLHGLNLDWRRFVTHQTREFMLHEISTVKAADPSLPATTNFMPAFRDLDYWKLAPHLDVISWDNYPAWHGSGTVGGADGNGAWDPQGRDWRLASRIGFHHDTFRAMGQRPFLLLESTPSATNWMRVAKRKRPGMHLLSSLHAVAHGADSVQYFQWRKSRGSSEKFHGAVVDHVGHGDTRVFSDVTDVGAALEALSDVAGSTVPAEAAVIMDWENRWALEDAQGPVARELRRYTEVCECHHHALNRLSVAVDVIDSEQDMARYKLVAAPMLYMVKPGVADRLSEFVRAGGTLVVTYWSGIVNENDLCFTGGFPGPLRELLGIWSEEMDALYPNDHLTVRLRPDREAARAFSRREYTAGTLADLVHTEGAEVLAEYAGQFYAGRPALTRKALGQGSAYYVAARMEQAFLNELYAAISAGCRPLRALEEPLPEGVFATLRVGESAEHRFLMNFTEKSQPVPPPVEDERVAYASPEPHAGDPATLQGRTRIRMDGHPAVLPPYGVQVRRRSAMQDG
jgi:beta-galactosidase